MFLGGHGFNILRGLKTVISLVLKAKQQKAIQLPFIFLKFYINQSSNQLLFLHFPGL